MPSDRTQAGEVAGTEHDRAAARVRRHQLRHVLDVREPEQVSELVEQRRTDGVAAVREAVDQVGASGVEHDLPGHVRLSLTVTD